MSVFLYLLDVPADSPTDVIATFVLHCEGQAKGSEEPITQHFTVAPETNTIRGFGRDRFGLRDVVFAPRDNTLGSRGVGGATTVTAATTVTTSATMEAQSTDASKQRKSKSLDEEDNVPMTKDTKASLKAEIPSFVRALPPPIPIDDTVTLRCDVVRLASRGCKFH